MVLASVYVLRMYIRSMHNRVGPQVASFDLSLRDGLVLVPLVLAILAFALYPQVALRRRRGRRSSRPCRRWSMSRRAAVKGPHIDWAAISPLIALTAGRVRRAAGRARALALRAPQRRARR